MAAPDSMGNARAAMRRHIYAPAARYYYLTWLLTLLVSAVWVQREGLGLFARRYPGIAARVAEHPMRRALARLLPRLAG